MRFNIRKFAMNAAGFVLLFGALFISVIQDADAAYYKNRQEYKSAYSCGIDMLKQGGSIDATPESLVASCIGNSHDPSKAEMQAFKDAIADVRGKNGAAAATSKQTTACTFAFGVYQANGSHADNFEEGPQKVTTMRKVARLWPSREFTIYDTHGVRIPDEIVWQWFYVVKKTKYGIEEVGITDKARKTCSKKQIG